MDYLQKIVGKAKTFITSRSLGFYFLVSALILSLVQIVIYNVAFSANDFIQYKHYSVILCASLAIVCGLLLSLTKWTDSFAAYITFFLELLSFLMFLKYGYMYFSELFFAGVTWTRITQMYYGYMASIILYLIIFVITIASFFMKQRKIRIERVATNEN